MKKREYKDFMYDKIGAAEDIESFIKGMTYEEFLLDRKTLNAVIRSLSRMTSSHGPLQKN